MCQRSYTDDALNFCLDDGEWLHGIDGDEPPTAVMPEASTRQFIKDTDEIGLVSTEDVSEVPGKFGKWVLAAPLLLAIFLVAGFFAFRYFKPSNSGTIASIAVLPFQNKNSDPDTDYLSDGLAESLIFRLSQLPGLKVSPTTSVNHYKGQETDVARIAKELGVDAVMSGRLVKRGDNLNITVELVDARNNSSLWGEQYERKMSDLLATQREIASTIAEKLQIKLNGDDTGVTKKYTDNNEAYQLYLKGRFYFAKRTKEDLLKSIEIYEQAVKLDPKFALGYVGIAESWTVIPSFSYGSPAECIPKAKIAVQRALELDPDLPEAHTVSAMIASAYDWDWAKAESEFKRSLELDPNLTITHYRYGWTFLSPMGRHDEAISEMRIAMDKEPLSLIQGANFAAVLIYARRFDEALAQAQKTYDLDPNFVGAQSWLCHSYNASGLFDKSISLAEKTIRINPAAPSSPFNGDLAYAYGKMGRLQEAKAILSKWKEDSKTKYVSNYWFAIGYAAAGDKDAAFAELEKAFETHDWFLLRIKFDPFMDPLRDDPRFNEMVKRLKFPE
jgi:TolB-like protein/Tfp pilus assembly protein PilF